jgi:hypothetical protein
MMNAWRNLDVDLVQTLVPRRTAGKSHGGRVAVDKDLWRRIRHLKAVPHSAIQAPKSALRSLTQRLGLAFLACTLVIGTAGAASADNARDEAAVRALGDGFAKAFVQKNGIPIRRKWNLRDTAG